jgi:hypothetical protein
MEIQSPGMCLIAGFGPVIVASAPMTWVTDGNEKTSELAYLSDYNVPSDLKLKLKLKLKSKSKSMLACFLLYGRRVWALGIDGICATVDLSKDSASLTSLRRVTWQRMNVSCYSASTRLSVPVDCFCLPSRRMISLDGP